MPAAAGDPLTVPPARSAPDGYTLLTAISSMTIQPSMQKNLLTAGIKPD
jgi:hypothetical protein